MRAGLYGAMLGLVGGLSGPDARADVPLPPPRPSELERQSPVRPVLDADVPLPPPRPTHLVPLSDRPVLGPPMPPPSRPALGPPMPQGLPPVLKPPVPASSPAPAPSPIGPGVPIAEELACVRLFTGGKVEARAVSPPVPAAPGCGIPAPAEVSAVIDPAGRRIPIEPPVLVDCAIGAALADWVRDDLVPAFAAGPGALVALNGTSGYACRGRNGVAGAKISEHGRGNAVDIGGFRTASGLIGVKQPGAPVLATIRDSACARFATVLGPGSDGYHESHMHVDLEERRHGSKICHWDLP